MEGPSKEGKRSSVQERNNSTDVEATKPASTKATGHDDEGLQIVTAYSGELEWTKEEERKVVRKINVRLLTLLTVSYGLQFYDKTMLGQAVRLFLNICSLIPTWGPFANPR